MTRLDVFFDTFFDWQIVLATFIGIMSERLRVKWRNRDTNPYKWSCVECVEAGGLFRCSANSIDVIDEMILKHKENSHGS